MNPLLMKRIGALFIDSVLLMKFTLIVACFIPKSEGTFQVLPFVIMVHAYFPGHFTPLFFYLLYRKIAGNSTDSGMLVLLLSMFFIEVCYHFIMEVLCSGTIGKMVFKIKVADSDSGKPGKGSLFVRSLTKTISKYLYFVPFAPVLFDKKRRTFHDMVSGTLVIEKK